MLLHWLIQRRGFSCRLAHATRPPDCPSPTLIQLHGPVAVPSQATQACQPLCCSCRCCRCPRAPGPRAAWHCQLCRAAATHPRLLVSGRQRRRHACCHVQGLPSDGDAAPEACSRKSLRLLQLVQRHQRALQDAYPAGYSVGASHSGGQQSNAFRKHPVELFELN